MNRAVWLGPVLLLLVGIGLWRTPSGDPPPPSAPGIPRRIVSLAPSLTELILALGSGDRLVGVTTYCEGVEPSVARIGDLRFDLERILELRPDRVIAIDTRSQAGLRRALEGRGVAVDVYAAESVDDVRAALRALGALLGAEREAAAWIARIDAALVPPSGEPISGVFVVERQSLTVAGGGSFVDEMLRAAGIANVWGGESWSYRRVELEAIIAHDPVIILDASFDVTEPAAFWGRFTALRAVRDGRVRPFPPVRPGVGIPEWVERLRAEARAGRE